MVKINANICKKLFVVICLFILLSISLFMYGCSNGQNSDKNVESQQSYSFIDSIGRKVELKHTPKRIFTTGPIAQMMIYAMDPLKLCNLSYKITAEMDPYIDNEIKDLPFVGGIYTGNSSVNYEEILNINPDLIIDVGENKSSIKEEMDELQNQTGVPTVHLNCDLKSMDQMFLQLGEVMKESEKAKLLSDYCRRVLSEINTSINITHSKKRVMYCNKNSGCNVICSGSYHSKVVEMIADNVAKCENVSPKGSGNIVDFEQVINWNPEVIIYSGDEVKEDLENNDKWRNISAVANKKYYQIPDSPSNWLGNPPYHQQLIGVLWLGKTLYPDICVYDLKSYVKEYFKLFFNYELSDNELKSLIKE